MSVIHLSKNGDGGLYYPSGAAASLASPGDIVELQGDYNYINLDGMMGAAGNPIIFRPSGIVRIGVRNVRNELNSYAWILSASKYIIIASDVNSTTDRIIVGGNAGDFIGQTFTFVYSDELEAYGLELCNGQVGFFSNSKVAGSGPYKNIKLHHNLIHTLDNPGESGRCEAFYIGRTDVASRTIGGSLENVEIYSNEMQNLKGDGIQVALTKDVYIHDNLIDGYGAADLEQQREGIIIGGCTNGRVENNIVKNGTGAGLQIFGGGEVIVNNNVFQNVASSANEDGIYIEGKCTDQVLTVRLTNNTIVGTVNRDYVRDTGSFIIENTGNNLGASEPPPPVVNNLFADIPAVVVAKQTIDFQNCGLDASNIRMIYEVGSPLKSWAPGRAINSIAGFTQGKGYYIIAKTDVDKRDILVPPLGP